MEAHPAASPPVQALLWPVPKTVVAAAAQARGKTQRKRTGVAVNPKRKRRYRLNKSSRAILNILKLHLHVITMQYPS